MNSLSRINVHVPFVFSQSIDPRNIYTVGDQVVCEYVYAFHARSSFKGGFEDLISQVQIDRAKSTVTFLPRYEMSRSDGSRYTLQDACDAFKSSVEGTRHSSLNEIVRKVECTDKGILVSLIRFPVNLPFLLTLSDFSLFDVGRLPLTVGLPTTGPYHLKSLSTTDVLLKKNPHYPDALQANSVDEVALKSFPAKDTRALIERLNPEQDHFIYFYGYALNDEQYRLLEKKDYEVEAQPSEWFTYLGFGSHTSLQDRILIGDFLDQTRSALAPFAAYGVPAFSTAPADRAFGLSEKEYKDSVALLPLGKNTGDLSRPLKLATLDEWAELPFFAEVLARLKTRFPKIAVTLVKRSEFANIYSAQHFDAYLSPAGMTPGDPMTHFMFMANSLEFFSKVLPAAKVSTAGAVDNPDLFIKTIKGFELELLRNRVLIPLFHFPGVTATSPMFEKTSKLGSAWGIQAWHYRLR